MARTAPVSLGGPELHSADLPITQPEDIGDDLADRANIIVADEAELQAKEYLDELAFMSEPVTILLHKGRERYAQNMHDFRIDGKVIWITVGTPATIPRSYLEVIARSQPYDIETHVNKNEHMGLDAPVENSIRRHQSARYPLTVVKDSNPKGGAWLAKIMRES